MLLFSSSSSSLLSSLLSSPSRLFLCNRLFTTTTRSSSSSSKSFLTLLSTKTLSTITKLSRCNSRRIVRRRTNNRFGLLTPSLLLLSRRGCFARGFSSSSSNYYSRRSMSKPYNIQRDGDSGTITISPKNEADQSALIVICHGLGDTSEGFVDVAEHIVSQLPYCKVILPTAPTQPVTMNMGMAMPSWYDIKGLDERSNEDCKGIEISQEKLVKILDNEHTTNGLKYERMILGGFSQGGALSLFTGLQLPVEKKLGGIFVMSAYLPCAGKFTLTEGLGDTPIFHGHGTADPLVLYEMASKSQQLCKEKGVTNYKIKSYTGLQHSVNIEEISDVTTYLKEILPSDDSSRIKLKDPSEMSIKELKLAVRNAGITDKTKGFYEKSEFIQLINDYRNGKL